MPASAAVLARDPLYRGYRFPAEIISHAVGRYYRFALSHRDVEEVLAARGVQVSYEAIRLWCRRFGPLFAGQLRRRRSRSADKWHCENGDAGGGGHDPKWHWLSAVARMPCPWICLPGVIGIHWTASTGSPCRWPDEKLVRPWA